ncbi:MAG: hypothetical protein H6671_06990 [Anaerolineaceae bacterium]|nr:hypothetical protein [Anaerolineaceae bacterium]
MARWEWRKHSPTNNKLFETRRSRACYLVQVDDEPGFNEPLVQESTLVFTPRYRAFPLANGIYYWRVQVGGTCNIVPGPWSETWSFTVAP